jgi:hypothetical protein
MEWPENQKRSRSPITHKHPEGKQQRNTSQWKLFGVDETAETFADLTKVGRMYKNKSSVRLDNTWRKNVIEDDAWQGKTLENKRRIFTDLGVEDDDVSVGAKSAGDCT